MELFKIINEQANSAAQAELLLHKAVKARVSGGGDQSTVDDAARVLAGFVGAKMAKMMVQHTQDSYEGKI